MIGRRRDTDEPAVEEPVAVADDGRIQPDCRKDPKACPSRGAGKGQEQGESTRCEGNVKTGQRGIGDGVAWIEI